MHRILTVCTGNICRSPVAEAAVRAALDGTTKRQAEVSSAGLHALVGRGIDADSAAAAQACGIPLHNHAARQFDTEIGQQCDVILVMETHHRQEIAQRWPHFLSKTFLIGHFDNARQVPDPYRQAMGMHAQAVEIILQCSESWAIQLRKMIT
ncbi:low molecular weight phosphotyrosine protein phosphatase [Roseinatronobacter domitianus]|uniref:arsenate reductase/protein-tyrosine-phosphatase family protein n=1 Tax=Roseinatronobacter domitianus TaxID=2940293 RepID=UPI003D16A956